MDMTPEPRPARVFALDGVPASGQNGTLASGAIVGDLLVDTTARALYVCTEVLPASGFTGPGQDHLQGQAASITWEPLA